MKKKLRDITYGEIVEICKKQGNACWKCPLRPETMCLLDYHPDEITEKEFNMEIEV